MLPPRDAPQLGIFGEWRATCHATSWKNMAPHIPLCIRLFPEPLMCDVALLLFAQSKSRARLFSRLPLPELPPGQARGGCAHRA